MLKNLVIVESPAKAKTIEGYLGSDFTVRSSYGHVRDLPKGNKAIDIANNYQPNYEVTADKVETVKQLKKMAKEAEMVWLATDDDREGEAISWHLKEALELKNEKIKRIVFREITKTAIQNAIKTPRVINDNLVNAQQARRVLDRLVGFELSPVLWKKVQAGLSAGRVQSVAVRIIVERERENDKFQASFLYKVIAFFDLGNGKTLTAELKEKVDTEQKAEIFLQKCIGAGFQIQNLETKPSKKSPAAPFTTSTLQQEASRKLSFSVAQTMSVAQKLYEAGKITYMRTDSTSLSQEAIQKASAEIKKSYGDHYIQNRQYKTKSESAQEAHEAIRPTDFAKHQVDGERNEQRLYELIWKRAIASQMADAQLERTIATIEISTTSQKLVAEGEVIKFDGFLAVYLEDSDDENEEDENKKMLPPLKIGQKLDLNEIKATQRFNRAAPRYTEASLVKKLEEMGIGRPSTYAPTISTIQKRGYIVKENRDGKERKYIELSLKDEKISRKEKTEIFGAEKSKLFPTDTAKVVNDFLVSHFDNIIDFSFTAKVEKEFDEIANGKIQWQKMIDNFYQGFHKQVESTQDITRKDAGTAREIGIHPNGKTMFAKIGRYGAYVQIGEATDTEKPVFASLKHGQTLETITLPEALELFKLPREVGNYENQTLTVASGRFGPYVKHGDKFYSLAKTDDPYTVSEERAIEIIQQKRQTDAQKTIKTFEEDAKVQVLNGRYGAYIKFGEQNVKIPKDKKPEELTYEECVELAKESEGKGRGGFKGTSKTSTKAKTTTMKATVTKKVTAKPVSKTVAKTTTPKTTAKTASKITTTKKKEK
jgi:DNA topoisomerase I